MIYSQGLFAIQVRNSLIYVCSQQKISPIALQMACLTLYVVSFQCINTKKQVQLDQNVSRFIFFTTKVFIPGRPGKGKLPMSRESRLAKIIQNRLFLNVVNEIDVGRKLFVCLFVTMEIPITVSWWAPDKEAWPSPYHYCS